MHFRPVHVYVWDGIYHQFPGRQAVKWALRAYNAIDGVMEIEAFVKLFFMGEFGRSLPPAWRAKRWLEARAHGGNDIIIKLQCEGWETNH